MNLDLDAYRGHHVKVVYSDDGRNKVKRGRFRGFDELFLFVVEHKSEVPTAIAIGTVVSIDPNDSGGGGRR